MSSQAAFVARIQALPAHVANATRAVRNATDGQALADAEDALHELVESRHADALVMLALRVRLDDPEFMPQGPNWRDAHVRVRLLGGATVRLRTGRTGLRDARRGLFGRERVTFPALMQLGIVEGATPALRRFVKRTFDQAGSTKATRAALQRRGIRVREARIDRWMATATPLPRQVAAVEPPDEPPPTEPRWLPLQPGVSESLAERLGLDELDATAFDIPIDLTPEVAAWVAYFVEGRGRSSFERWLGREVTFRPSMVSTLDARGLPRDLVYLSMIESGYDPRAYSHADASGLWQFIEPTARTYGLRIDAWVDERNDPQRSLDAAARYLSDLHERLGDWRLAWAAYNTGLKRVEAALSRSDTRDFWTLARRRHLHPETRDYVPAIMAATIVGHDPLRYGLTVTSAEVPPVEVVEMMGPLDLAQVARASNTTTDQLLELNPDLRRAATPPRAYALRVLKGQGIGLVERLSALPRAGRLPKAFHRVQVGEDLAAVSSWSGNPVELLRDLNDLPHGEPAAGDTLTLLTLPPLLAPQKPSVSHIHVVRKGESASAIAGRYGMSLDRLVSLNRISDPERIDVGQRLYVEVRSDSTPSRRSARRRDDWSTYRVRRGDNLTKIADSFGVDPRELMAWNELKSPTVRVGQRIWVRRPRIEPSRASP